MICPTLKKPTDPTQKLPMFVKETGCQLNNVKTISSTNKQKSLPIKYYLILN